MTLARRIIPCLDVDAGRVVKGVEFTGLRDMGDPEELAARYNGEGADELILLDITASRDGRATFLDTVRRVARAAQYSAHRRRRNSPPGRRQRRAARRRRQGNRKHRRRLASGIDFGSRRAVWLASGRAFDGRKKNAQAVGKFSCAAARNRADATPQLGPGKASRAVRAKFC